MLGFELAGQAFAARMDIVEMAVIVQVTINFSFFFTFSEHILFVKR